MFLTLRGGSAAGPKPGRASFCGELGARFWRFASTATCEKGMSVPLIFEVRTMASKTGKVFQETNAVVAGWQQGQGRPDAALQSWIAAVRAAEPDELIEVIGGLTSEEEKKAANIKALREAMISELERRNAALLAHTMEKLDASATRLAWLSIVLTVVGVITGILQLLPKN